MSQAMSTSFLVLMGALSVVWAPLRAETPPAYAVEAFAGQAAQYSYPNAGVRASEVLFPELRGVAVDRNGNVYFAAPAAQRVYRLRPDGSFETFAGTGIEGTPAGNRPATQVNLSWPEAVFVDGAGNVYIAQSNRIMKVTPDGMLQVVGGGGASGATGEGQVATSAALSSVVAVVADAAGNIYFADNNRYRVARIAAGTGILTTLAGGAYSATETGDGGPAVNARFTAISDLAIDQSGALYVSTRRGYVRKFTPGGNITRVLGGPNGGEVQWTNLPAGATAATALLSTAGVVLDEQGNLYVTSTHDAAASGNVLVRCTQAGVCTLLAGSGVTGTGRIGRGGFRGDGGPATSAHLARPRRVARDAAGNLYLSDFRRIRRITPGGTITTLAGSTAAALFGEGRPVAQLLLGEISPAQDRQGNIYLADRTNYRVWKIGADGIARSFAGTGTPGYTGDGGPATAADLGEIVSLAVDGAGNVYLGDSDLRRVRRVRPDGTIETFAGVDWNSCAPNSNNGLQASQMCLSSAGELAADGAGNVYISGDNLPYKITPQGVVQVLSTQLTTTTYAVAVDNQDNTYWVVGNTWAEVRKMTPAGVVTRFAGTGTAGTSGDGGPATAAQVSVNALAVDAEGRVYLADSNNRRLRMVDRDGLIHHIGGDNRGRFYPDLLGWPAKSAFLSGWGITVDAARRVYIGVLVAGIPGCLLRLEPAVVCRRCVTNAANYVGGKIAPGELLTIFPMTPFGPPQLVRAELVDGGRQFPTTVANTRVLFDGVASPIIYALATQTSVAAPYSIAGKQQVEMVIEYGGQRTPPTRLDVVEAVPGIFTLNQSGRGQAAVLNWPTYAVNGPQNKIAKGGVIMVFGTVGGGQGQDGRLVEGIVPSPHRVEFFIDNRPATVHYAGSAPDLISGVFQANVEVPAAARSGDCIRIMMRVNGISSEEGFPVGEYACIAIQ